MPRLPRGGVGAYDHAIFTADNFHGTLCFFTVHAQTDSDKFFSANRGFWRLSRNFSRLIRG